eukprot:SAG31_NODE_10326_length_1153_cov_1.853890_3_plen_85_part_00
MNDNVNVNDNYNVNIMHMECNIPDAWRSHKVAFPTKWSGSRAAAGGIVGSVVPTQRRGQNLSRRHGITVGDGGVRNMFFGLPLA